MRPFNPSGWGEETAEDDAIRITLTVPAGWAGVGTSDVMLRAEGNHPPGGAGIIFIRGASMYSNPCHNDGVPDIQVGPTVDDFADALADHPRLDVTAPTDVTLSGYSGKYLDLQVPADPTIQGSSEGASASGCPIYRPWEPGLFAQGPSHRWHLWILDVDGIRVVIQATDYPSTAPQRQSELRAMVESMQITAD